MTRAELFCAGYFLERADMRNIDFQLTLMDSAQVFHWQKTENGYAAAVNGNIMTESDETEEAKYYFDDARDYSGLERACCGYEQAVRAVNLLKGLRVLNQPAWETVIAFILSANNNVKRIRNLVLALCREYGRPLAYQGKVLYSFPTPDVLAGQNPNSLRQLVTCGYRAEYLIETAKMVAGGFDLNALKDMPLERARKELLCLKGIGPKVADCVLLFGCGHTDAFPVDIWVKRLMENWFHVTGSPQKISEKAREMLGPDCGLIQQALFHAARCGLIEV